MAEVDRGGLNLRNLRIAYGRRIAVSQLDLDVAQGESVALVGANGAGKTSTLEAIAGLRRGSVSIDGSLEFQGKSLAWGDVSQRLASGIGLVPEKDKIFPLLTVRDNLRIAGRRAVGDKVRLDDVLGWFPRLGERRRTLAGNLSGGEQQMLALAASLIGTPRLVALDEPTLGLAVPIIEGLCASLASLRRDLNLTLVVSESDSQWLPALVDRAVVIDRGRFVAAFDQLDDKRLNAIHDLMLGLAEPSPASQEVRYA